jgi:hypothetical protein
LRRRWNHAVLRLASPPLVDRYVASEKTTRPTTSEAALSATERTTPLTMRVAALSSLWNV